MHQFDILSITEQYRLKEMLATTPQITSDYTFLNLWGWQDVYGLKFMWDEKLLWIKQDTSHQLFWAPVGDWENTHWIDYLDFLKGKTFIRVPEKLAEIWKRCFPNKVKIIEDRDNWDYLYSVKELIELKGNKFHKKKNLLRQFQKKYKYRFVKLEDKWIEEAENFQVDWCYYKDCENKDILIQENKVILNVLENWDKLKGVIGGGLIVGNSLIAYTIAEPVDRETIVIHFEKGCPTYKGVYQAINCIFLKESASNFTFVNREQDLGDKGLRQAKLSYNPCGFLKKYRVEFKNIYR